MWLDGVLRLQDRIYVPNVPELRKMILKKELRRSDFLFDRGYVGARALLLSTSK